MVGVQSTSYEQAVYLLGEIGNIIISTSQIQRLTDRVGDEFVAYSETDESWDSPALEEALPGEVATISMDGGRAQVRADNQGGGVHDPCWRETKIACLQFINSTVQDTDPHPQLPTGFADPEIVSNLVSGLKREVKNPRGPDKANKNLQKKLKEVKQNRQSVAKPVRRFSVADIGNVTDFGSRVLSKAIKENLDRAKRKAFLADGDRKLWGVQELYFKGWIPILDFVHATEYAFDAAQCTSKIKEEVWAQYIQYITDIWEGNVFQVICDIEAHLANRRVRTDSDSKTTQANIQKLREVANYFENNAKRMNYPEYRKQGLPVSSCHVESLIKQFNHRVKSTEKFWNESSLKGMLHLKAATLSDDRSLDCFWNSRYDNQTNTTRRYTRKAV